MYRKVRKINDFRSLLLASRSLQELSIVGSCVKRVCGSQHVGESLSSSQHSTVRRCQHSTIRGESFDLLLPRIRQLHYSTFHNFWKLESFINAGLGLVLKYINNIHHLARKFARIFVRGHYLFRARREQFSESKARGKLWTTRKK